MYSHVPVLLYCVPPTRLAPKQKRRSLRGTLYTAKQYSESKLVIPWHPTEMRRCNVSDPASHWPPAPRQKGSLALELRGLPGQSPPHLNAGVRTQGSRHQPLRPVPVRPPCTLPSRTSRAGSPDRRRSLDRVPEIPAACARHPRDLPPPGSCSPLVALHGGGSCAPTRSILSSARVFGSRSATSCPACAHCCAGAFMSPPPPPPPRWQGAQPMPSHCPPDAKCQPQRHL